MLPAMTDLRAQLARLVHPGFIAEAGPSALREYPRYLGRWAQGSSDSPTRPGTAS